jgi:SAM-dependent methyltransferase
MRGDGAHPPEGLPALLHAALGLGHRAVFAARPLGRQPALLAERLARSWHNHVLGLRLRDPGSGYRLLSRSALERIPFQLDADDRRFDAQIAIQHRALGVPIHEVLLSEAWSERPPGAAGIADWLRCAAPPLDYRLHQLHATRRGRYFVDLGAPYTLKRSPTGSHVQIVDAVAPGSRVLDLGCSQGLLAAPLRAKGVRVTGVDARRSSRLATELDAYHERDLERPLELPTGRVFDYVVVSDVIEHVNNRGELLRSVRRYLEPGGRLLISTPNVALWFYRLSLLVGRFEYGPRGVLDESHVHLYTRATFRREVEKAGFHVLSERVTALPFELVFESTGRSRLLRTVARAYHALARLWPELFAYQFLIEAEITTLDEDATRPTPPPPHARTGRCVP